MKIISNYEYIQLNNAKRKVTISEDELKFKDETIDHLRAKLKDQDQLIKTMQDKFELREKQAVAALEDKLAKEITKLESAHNKDITALERKLTQEKQNDLEKMMKENYAKLSDSMTKLHEEGNAQTKFMQETTQTLLQSASGFARASNTSTQIAHNTNEMP